MGSNLYTGLGNIIECMQLYFLKTWQKHTQFGAKVILFHGWQQSPP